MKLNEIIEYIKKMFDSQKGSLGTGQIKAVLIGLMFLTVLLSMAPNLIHTSAASVQTLSVEYSNTTLYGTGASAIGEQVDDWTGYFWVIGPFVLIIGVILGVFALKRRR